MPEESALMLGYSESVMVAVWCFKNCELGGDADTSSTPTHRGVEAEGPRGLVSAESSSSSSVFWGRKEDDKLTSPLSRSLKTDLYFILRAECSD